MTESPGNLARGWWLRSIVDAFVDYPNFNPPPGYTGDAESFLGELREFLGLPFSPTEAELAEARRERQAHIL